MAYKNLAYGTVLTPPSPATSGTSLVLDSGHGARFPDADTEGAYWATVAPASADPTPDNAEIIKITADAADTFTIVRAERGSSARTIVAGDRVFLGIYKEDIGLTSIVRNEVPGGSVNGSNTAFTTLAALQTGSLRVYQNGIRLKAGGNDFTESAQGFTMATAPATGDILLVDYETNGNNMAIGTNSFISAETPSGTVNGSNASFTIANAPVAGTLQLYRDGQLLVGGGADYTLSGTTITFVTAPVTGSVLLAYYQVSVAASANADTVDGLNASDTPSDGKLISDYGGWQKVNGSWAYASASTITVPTGAASYYQKGDRIRWKQGGGYKYGVIVTVADTLLTIAVNTDYTVANSAITDMYYSHQASPMGYPTWFSFTPTWTGFSANPTGGIAKFNIIGTQCTIRYSNWSSATSNSTSFTIGTPITALETLQTAGTGHGYDNSGWANFPARIDTTAGSATLSCFQHADTRGWTASNTKNIFFVVVFQI